MEVGSFELLIVVAKQKFLHYFSMPSRPPKCGAFAPLIVGFRLSSLRELLLYFPWSQQVLSGVIMFFYFINMDQWLHKQVHGDSLCVYRQYQPTNALYNINSICMLFVWNYVHRIMNENWMFNANAYMCPTGYLFTTWNANENCDAFIKNMHDMRIIYAMYVCALKGIHPHDMLVKWSCSQ